VSVKTKEFSLGHSIHPFLGSIFLYYSLKDFVSIRDKSINNYKFGGHACKMFFSLLIIVSGFIISQFNWINSPYTLLLWFTLFIVPFLGIYLINKKSLAIS
jgi:hypothetical protein